MPKMKMPVSGSVDMESIAAAGIAKKNDLPDMRKIDISHIVDMGNVRQVYEDIEELAASIEEHGLLQPISVKVLDPDPQGLPRYELVAGFRRWKAFQYLYGQSKGFAMIDAILVTGDKLILQLIENIQRADLAPKERESGIALICASGVPKGDVAKMLSKSTSFVSRNIGAYEIRKFLDDAGINTSNIDTTILYALHKIADDKDFLPTAGRQLIDGGGTKSMAELIVTRYEAAQKAKNFVPNLVEKETYADDPQPVEAEKPIEKDDSDSTSSIPPPSSPSPENVAESSTQPESQVKPEKSAGIRELKSSKAETEKDDFPENFPEKYVRFDKVAETILDYISRVEQEADQNRSIAGVHRSMAGKEILTLLQKRLCND
jgi:ParB/RepB/Spo0J family partition protein